jgi:activator of HSP90 ATPase
LPWLSARRYRAQKELRRCVSRITGNDVTKPIIQSVTFAASAQELYDIYLDPKRHATVTGGKVKISAKPGSAFSAFNGMLSGTMLWTIPGQMIVQRWKSTGWNKGDPDSILILTFDSAGKKGRIKLVHVNVPVQDHAGVTNGWKKYYWAPLKAYLRGKPSNSKT